MCKLFIATGSFSKRQVVAMLAATNKAFSSSQRDGFGFVAYGGKGKLAYGKYLDPSAYAGFDANLPKWVHAKHIEVGNLPEVTTALVIHGRTSTNRVMIENAHPFHHEGTFLAHNGVLSWIGKGPAPDAKNGCDTEQFFNWFQANKSGDSAWDATPDHWSGYGVFGIVDSNKGTLTVSKCGSGNLRWVGSKGNHFFSTDGADLIRITRAASFRYAKTSEMTRRTRILFKLNATGSTVKSVDDWKGFGTRVVDDSWRRSMGSPLLPADSLKDRRDREAINDYLTKTSETPSELVSKRLGDDAFRSVSVPRYPDNERDLFQSFPDYDNTR